MHPPPKAEGEPQHPRGSARVRPPHQGLPLPPELAQSCSVLGGLLGAGAMLCGTLVVLYLWTRCGRRARRSSGESRDRSRGWIRPTGGPDPLVGGPGLEAPHPGAGDPPNMTPLGHFADKRLLEKTEDTVMSSEA